MNFILIQPHLLIPKLHVFHWMTTLKTAIKCLFPIPHWQTLGFTNFSYCKLGMLVWKLSLWKWHSRIWVKFINLCKNTSSLELHIPCNLWSGSPFPSSPPLPSQGKVGPVCRLYSLCLNITVSVVKNRHHKSSESLITALICSNLNPKGKGVFEVLITCNSYTSHFWHYTL